MLIRRCAARSGIDVAFVDDTVSGNGDVDGVGGSFIRLGVAGRAEWRPAPPLTIPEDDDDIDIGTDFIVAL